MAASDTMRIVLLGKTGGGKSSLGNTILGDDLFEPDDTSSSGTKTVQAGRKEVNGRSVTVIDTPGFFDTSTEEENLKSEIVKCITECADGVHAFLIVFKLEKFTEHEQAVISKVCEYFSEEALKYASIVFTRGDDLTEGQKIEDFVASNQKLHDLVKKCGGGCHVFDNRRWKNIYKYNYRSNEFQRTKLLKNIDEMIRRNKGKCYNNNMLQEVSKKIDLFEEGIRAASPYMPEEEIRRQAREAATGSLMENLKGVGFAVLMTAFLGLTESVAVVTGVGLVASVAAVVYYAANR